MTEQEKLKNIDLKRRNLERAIKRQLGLDATVTIALHDAPFEQLAGGFALGWTGQYLQGCQCLSANGPQTPGHIGQTVIYHDMPSRSL